MVKYNKQRYKIEKYMDSGKTTLRRGKTLRFVVKYV